MKKSYVKNKLISIVVITAIFVGCEKTTSTDSTNTNTSLISGQLVNGYVKKFITALKDNAFFLEKRGKTESDYPNEEKGNFSSETNSGGGFQHKNNN